MTLFDLRMNDGSRHFADVPERYDVEHPAWHRLREYLSRTDGAELTGFVTDDITEAWIDFTLAGFKFSANNQHGNWWLFVTDPDCPDAVLERARQLVIAALAR